MIVRDRYLLTLFWIVGVLLDGLFRCYFAYVVRLLVDGGWYLGDVYCDQVFVFRRWYYMFRGFLLVDRFLGRFTLAESWPLLVGSGFSACEGCGYIAENYSARFVLDGYILLRSCFVYGDLLYWVWFFTWFFWAVFRAVLATFLSLRCARHCVFHRRGVSRGRWGVSWAAGGELAVLVL